MKLTTTTPYYTLTIDLPDAAPGADDLHDEAHRAACDALNIGREGAPGLPGMVGHLARQRDEARREREVCALRLRDAAVEAETLRVEVARLRTNMAAEVERLTRERDCEMADNDNLVAQRAELQLEVARLTANLTATEDALRIARNEDQNWHGLRSAIGCAPNEPVDDAVRRLVDASKPTTRLRCELHAALGMGPCDPATNAALVARAAHLIERAQDAQAEGRT